METGHTSRDVGSRVLCYLYCGILRSFLCPVGDTANEELWVTMHLHGPKRGEVLTMSGSTYDVRIRFSYDYLNEVPNRNMKFESYLFVAYSDTGRASLHNTSYWDLSLFL